MAIGQFVPAVTPADSVGDGDRSLQLLQLENSDAFRTNIGLAETTGKKRDRSFVYESYLEKLRVGTELSRER